METRPCEQQKIPVFFFLLVWDAMRCRGSRHDAAPDAQEQKFVEPGRLRSKEELQRMPT